MNTKSLSDAELNGLIGAIQFPDGLLHSALTWQRIDIGGRLETYVGDQKYIIAVVTEHPKDMDEMANNTVSAKETITEYLTAEGFVNNNNWVYVGLQKIDLQNPPEGLQYNE